MKLNEFQHLSSRTMPKQPYEHKDFANYALGVVGEAAEASDHIKKFVFHGHDLNREKVKEELGDCLHYLSGLAKMAGYTLEEVAQGNVEKLKKRYKDGFSTEASKKRVDVHD